MKTKLLLCLALVLSGVVLTSSSCQSFRDRQINKTSSEKNGVAVEVSIPGAVSAGQPVEMLVNVTNAGPNSVFFKTWISALGIHLVDSNKATPEMTRRGKSGPDSVIDSGIVYGLPTMKELKSREAYEWRVDLGTLFILRPGEYLVSLKLKLDATAPGGAVPLVISTDPLEFVIQ
ncbi:MAG TPA: hypothetical protein VFY06_01100 [Verrucomicrobiae bacterium]|nr:hypothetical protein [Verrucomicrobiae bacterium]